MKTLRLIFTIILSLGIGMLLYTWHRGWIVIKLPATQQVTHQEEPTQKNLKKNVMLSYWHNDKWQRENVELIWTTDTAKTIEYLLNNWLSLLDEEQVIDKKITIQSVALTQSNYAYISFDRNPFNKEQTTFEKLQWIEGLLKTIRDNGIKLQGIYFLVQHQPLIDPHLDFSNSWPLSGFRE
jgi:hypothetical protein